MTDSLKFGPEWLRMSSTSSTSSPNPSTPASAAASVTNSAPRYPLSEFRYGREEMLALFDKNLKHPEILPRYKNLFVEKLQFPLALTPSAEDDPVAARMWPMRSSPGLSVRGGRGGIMDRGRGRGRGAYHSGERWSERNGTDPDWASGLPSTSPRKEYNAHGRGSSIESWRRPRGDDEPLEQWRSGSLGPREQTKWGRSTSWREEDSTLAESRGYNNDRGYTNTGMEQRPGGGGLPSRAMNRRPWDVPEDNLPEWAVDNPLESGGSFDATGAFHGSDDELAAESSAKMEKNTSTAKSQRKEMNGSANELEEEQQDRATRNPREKEGRKQPSPDEKLESPEAPPPAPGGDSAAKKSPNSEMDAAEAKHQHPPPPMNVDRMQEVADDMVEKLIMDDELSLSDEKDKLSEDGKLAGGGGMGGLMAPKGPPPETEWFYRDPQDMVQGPFSAVEMAEWYQAGYFDNNLCVRRKNDQRFSKLGDLIDMCGGEMPFFVPYRALPMMGGPMVDAQPMKGPPLLPHRMMDMDPSLDPRVLRQNYIASQQAMVYQKLSSADMWHMLSAEQQRQMIRKHVAQLPIPDSIYGPPPSAGDSNMAPFGLFDLMNKPPPPAAGPVVDSAIIQQNLLAKKMHQQQQRIVPPGGGAAGQQHLPMMPPQPQEFPPVLNPADPLNQLMHNMRLGFPQGQPNNVMPSMMGPQQAPPSVNAADNDRIKTLLMQLSMQKGMQPQPGGSASVNQMMQHPGMMPWQFGQPMGPLNMAGGVQPPNAVDGNSWKGLVEGHGPSPNGPGGLVDLGRPPNNPGAGGIWELEHKLFNNNTSAAKPIEMKTEKQIIEEQQMAAMLQKEKEKELLHEEQQQQMHHQQQQQMQQSDQFPIMNNNNQQHNEANDNKGWTKVESKTSGSVGKVDASQKDKKGAAADDKNAKKKDVPLAAGKQPQAAKKEEAGKKPMTAQEANKQQQQQLQKGKVAPAANQQPVNNKSQQAKGGNNGPSNAKSVAPWSINQPQQEAPGLSLAEIQKLELEQQRAGLARMEHIMQQQQQWFDSHNLKADLPKWNAPQIAPSVVKSLAEIQAEEAKMRQWQETQAAAAAAAANVQAPAPVVKKVVEEPSGAVWGSAKVWSSNGQPPSSMAGFWEEPVKSASSAHVAAVAKGATAAGGKTIAKSQTMSSIQGKTPAAATSSGNVQATKGMAGQKGGSNSKQAAAATSSAITNGGTTNKKEAKSGKGNKKDDASGQEFTQWCTKALSAYNSTIDIPTFVSFLQDIESPYEVKDYIRVYLGETKECTDFCKQFLERRSKYKNQIRAQNAHVDDMCSPAPALTPSSDFQEVKGKAKKVKKNKMMKLDSRILGFSVTAAQDRINVGDRDYPNAS